MNRTKWQDETRNKITFSFAKQEPSDTRRAQPALTYSKLFLLCCNQSEVGWWPWSSDINILMREFNEAALALSFCIQTCITPGLVMVKEQDGLRIVTSG